MNYYSLDKIVSEHAQYNMIIGERSNGKTYACLEYALRNYCQKHEASAYIRRWNEDLIGKRGASLFNNLVSNDLVRILTNGEWTDVYYYSQRWYLCKYDEKGLMQKSNEPFCYGFALTQSEHDKSSSYPNVTTIIFDEFLTRGGYIPDEFVLFMNVISTIIRLRTNVKIFMLGNTVNQYCPYFAEMGIEEVKNMQQGTIRLYSYGESGLKLAVEYCASMKSVKDNNMYFAFNNPKLNMITSGAWELDLYPHLPAKYRPADVIFTYFIEFVNDVLQCEIVQLDDGNSFTFIHRKTTPIKKNDDVLYSPDYSANRYHYRNLYKTPNRVTKVVRSYYDNDRVFYQDNMVGEIVHNYLQWCQAN